MDLNGSLVSYLFLIFKDHAHPTMVPGHPFKGGWVMSTGMLMNPEGAKFGI